ncbi:MAG: 3-keto-5-aminohexanoate cleavage protein [Acidiphilium sp. 34-60-192]|nr:MAG: 3-keto-5-aminohexanoate cleavage protein [Acidiphilium sp. 34-60-192]
MTEPVIITVAINGAVARKADNPAVPISPAEQIESIHQAFEAGATLAHIHARNPDESPGSDPALFAAVHEGVRRHCPSMIVQFSTGGRGRSLAERAACIPLRPDMASLATGSTNFPTQVYDNPPDFVTGLAHAMLYNAKALADQGLLAPHPHVQFVLGVRNALPVRREIFNFLLAELRALMPTATWKAAGIGRWQAEVARWCIAEGGHVRTGLEDNLRFDGTRLAASNAELVTQMVEIAACYGRRPATAEEARRILGLAAA